jgi:hypothetical protein
LLQSRTSWSFPLTCPTGESSDDLAIDAKTGKAPQIEIRPEVPYDKPLDAFASNGNSGLGIAPTKNVAIVGMADMILYA